MSNKHQLGYGSPDGDNLGKDASAKIAFYGTTAISQRAAAAQATSAVGTASSTAITSDVKAALIEVMNTLAALGLWKGSA